MALNPTKTALLVIDMQKDFYADGGNARQRGKPVKYMQSLPAKINDFAARLREQGAKIVFTKFLYDPKRSPKNYTEIIQGTKNSNWMCEAGSEGAELDGVTVEANDTVIEKYSYDCFAGTNLLEQLRAWDIETIIITGVRTEVCVLATAGRSFAEGFRTIVVSDLVGTYDDKTTISEAVLDVLRYSSYVLTSNKVKERLSL